MTPSLIFQDRYAIRWVFRGSKFEPHADIGNQGRFEIGLMI